MPRYELPRLSIEPVDRALRIRGWTWADLARAVGRHRDTIGQLHCSHRDGIRWETADRVAVALDFHPAELWGADWWALCDAYDAVSAQLRAERNRRYGERRGQAARRGRRSPAVVDLAGG